MQPFVWSWRRRVTLNLTRSHEPNGLRDATGRLTTSEMPWIGLSKMAKSSGLCGWRWLYFVFGTCATISLRDALDWRPCSISPERVTKRNAAGVVPFWEHWRRRKETTMQQMAFYERALPSIPN